MKTIWRTKPINQAKSLPKITLYNMRSIWSKLKNKANDMKERSASISIINELWMKEEDKEQEDALKEIHEMDNVKAIVNPRKRKKRGGGVGFLQMEDDEDFSLEKVDVNIPKNLETLWAILRLKRGTGQLSKIILCSFYCPPLATKKTKDELITHIIETVHKLKLKYPAAGVIIAGDANKLQWENIIKHDKSLKGRGM